MINNWALLRGLGRQAGHWGDFPARLEAKLEGGKVLPLEPPGMGRLKDRQAPWQLPGFIEELRAQLLEVRRPGEAWGLIGMSLGGMIGMQWISAYPDDFSGLVVCNTSASNLSPLWHRMRPANYPTILGMPLWAPEKREQKTIDMATNHPDRGREVLIEQWSTLSRNQGAPLSSTIRQLFAGLGATAPVELKQPVLALRGGKDRLVDPRCSEALVNHLGKTSRISLQTHDTAGHDLAEDAPDWLIEQVLSWSPDDTAAG